MLYLENTLLDPKNRNNLNQRYMLHHSTGICLLTPLIPEIGLLHRPSAGSIKKGNLCQFANLAWSNICVRRWGGAWNWTNNPMKARTAEYSWTVTILTISPRSVSWKPTAYMKHLIGPSNARDEIESRYMFMAGEPDFTQPFVYIKPIWQQTMCKSFPKPYKIRHFMLGHLRSTSG